MDKLIQFGNGIPHNFEKKTWGEEPCATRGILWKEPAGLHVVIGLTNIYKWFVLKQLLKHKY